MLKRVTLGDPITAIPDYAFSYCYRLHDMMVCQNLVFFTCFHTPLQMLVEGVKNERALAGLRVRTLSLASARSPTRFSTGVVRYGRTITFFTLSPSCKM